MKIAMVVKLLLRDGVCLSVVNRAIGLRRLGHEVTIIGGDGPGREFADLHDIPQHIIPIRRVRSWPQAHQNTMRWLSNWNVDIVHTHWRYANVFGRILARRLRVPHVSTLHSEKTAEGWLQIKLSCWGDWIICLTSEAADYMHNRIGIPRERIAVVPHGVDSERFTSVDDATKGRLRARYGLSPTDRVIVSLGRLCPVKGHHLLIEALGRIHARYPDLRLLIAGDGPGLADLRDLASQRGVSAKVIMPGWVDSADVLPATDVCALVSNSEAFAVAPVEAGMCGLPLIRTAVPGASDTVFPGTTGQIIQVGDVDALTTVLEDFAENADNWANMGAQAQKLFREKFEIVNCARMLTDVYRKALS